MIWVKQRSHSVKKSNLSDKQPPTLCDGRSGTGDKGLVIKHYFSAHSPWRNVVLLWWILLLHLVWWRNSPGIRLTNQVDPFHKLLEQFFEPNNINYNVSINSLSRFHIEIQSVPVAAPYPMLLSDLQSHALREYHPSKSRAGGSYSVCLWVEVTWFRCCISALICGVAKKNKTTLLAHLLEHQGYKHAAVCLWWVQADGRNTMLLRPN